MEKKVEILLTTYNSNLDFLKEQIDSILTQTYKNISLLISDDKSSNQEVIDLLKKYEEKDKRIKLYLQEKNLGYNKNFEFLLKCSGADYIMFCDHDDIWNSDKVEKSLKKILEEKVDLVYCNAEQINEKGEIIQKNYFKYKNVPLINRKSHIAISRCIGIGCSQIITKDVKNKMLPFLDSVIAHDWLASFIANENRGISYIKEPLFDYRLHNTNVFGGRNLSQNIKRWKEKNGKKYKSFLEYRKDVINRAYDSGIKMCFKYSKNKENQEFCKKAEEYYKKLYEVKTLNISKLPKYFQILNGKNQGKKKIREIVLFHLPIIAYLKFFIG